MVGQRNLGSGKKKGRSVRGKREMGAVDGLNLEKKKAEMCYSPASGNMSTGDENSFY